MSDVIGQCPICRISIRAYEPHEIDDWRDYHHHCWIKHIGIEIARLEKKTEKKTITLEEATKLEESKKLLYNDMILETTKPIPKSLREQTKKLELVTRPQIREECKRSTLEEKMRNQEILREARWMKEAIENEQKKLTECDNSKDAI